MVFYGTGASFSFSFFLSFLEVLFGESSNAEFGWLLFCGSWLIVIGGWDSFFFLLGIGLGGVEGKKMNCRGGQCLVV